MDRFPPPANAGTDALDHARREWLAGLAAAHREAPSARTALELAQGCWRCGEYADAWPRFVEARDRAPDAAGAHLALLRAASMLGFREDEAAALASALQAHPDDPQIVLHAALSEVPDDLEQARARLMRVANEPACAGYALAIDVVAGRQPPDTIEAVLATPGLDPGQRARWESLRWAARHADGPARHVGLPSRVLECALAAASLEGLTMECGVYFGRSLDIIARRLGQPVHGFDSFQGLPEAWKAGEGAGSYSTAGRLPKVAANVSLHPGWFERSLPPFLDAHPGPVRLLHIDCDIYSSTRTVLEAVGPRLQAGSVIVFDDMLGYPGYETHELRAFTEFVERTGLRWELLAACLLGREVAVRISGH
ncbi:class I SAM-dependent methyltransferase [Marilutibacter chinensis]|uniref:Class I SAM-dependent methyltransferase n=1 Tax=Marilutibacter chinensis TaxID=2912247 RepID=A0ABS9HUZ9_9GAMM|nr:class I SAM-dependent methyltransferase [Lysobacter chinensis]MCF7222700.1 class I SAM-dependent methyltransferase [Lysobacter chinensis]